MNNIPVAVTPFPNADVTGGKNSLNTQQQLLQLKRRQAIADQLQGYAQKPIETQISGTASHPIAVNTGYIEPISKIVSALIAAKYNEGNDEQYGKILEAMNAKKSEAVTNLGTKYSPSSAQAAIDAGANPELVNKIVEQNKPEEPYTLGPGQQRFDKNTSIASVPQKQEPYTLGPGQTRFDSTNQQLASVAPKPGEQIGKPNPGEFTPQSLDNYAKSGKFSDLVRTYAPTAAIQGNAAVSDQAIKFAADTYRSTGKFPTTMGRNPALQARVLNMVAADAAGSGDTVGAINARQGALKANNQALDQVTKQEAATTSYYNTLDKNLSNLQELSGKIDSSGVPLINKVYRAYQQNVSGDPDVAKYVTYLRSASSEFAKIQSGSLGNAPASDAARRDADEVINKYLSQGQLDAVIQAMRGEGGNRLQAIAEQKKSLLTDLGQAPPAQGAQPAPPKQAIKTPTTPGPPKGYKLMQDAQGNKAYVGPNGEIQEVQ